MSAIRTKTGTGQRANWIWQYDAQAFGNSDVVIGTPAMLQSLIISSKAASGTLWVQLHDAISLPNNGAVPDMVPIPLVGGTIYRLELTDAVISGYDGPAFVNGICWAASSTAGTLTVDSTNSIWVTARYIA